MANSKNITFDQLQSALTRVKNSLDKKANTSHGNHVPKTETANNARFLRNDNTWQTITPVNIGAADRSHNHTSLTGVTKLQFAAGSSDSAVMKVTTEEANTYLDFEMNDDTNTDMYRWRFSAYASNGATPYFNLMTLTAKDTTSARLTVNGDVTASSFTGNATSATKLQSARALKIGNTSKNFDGTGNVTWSLSEIGAASSGHSHTNINFLDKRSENTTPANVSNGVSLHLKSAGTAGLNDGGRYYASLFLKPWNDISGGPYANIAVTGNHNMWLRTATSDSTWNNWKQIAFTSSSITGNAATATKLQNARNIKIGNTTRSFNGTGNVTWTLSDIGAAASNHGHSNMLTFKANHAGDWTSATSMADKVYMGGWHGTITDSSKNKGYVSLGLATSDKALDFMLDGDFYANENNLVLNTGNYKSHVTPANIGAAASNHNHGLLHNNLTVTVANTTTDNGWSMINSSYNGYILKSIRSNANAPAWLQGDYAAGIAFGGGDTKGVMSVAYNAPSIRFAGGNGTKPVWNMTLTGTSGKSYNMDSLAANTANTLAAARTINGTSFNGSGNITTANWGTGRTITIGNKGKTVNGSGNVSWSLSEIGALPTAGGTVSGNLNVTGAFSIGGKKITINSSAPSSPAVGDIWIKI